MLVLLIISSLATIYWEFMCDIETPHKDFYLNVSFSIMGSSFLVWFITIVEYEVEKILIQREFDAELLDIIIHFNNFKFLIIEERKKYNDLEVDNIINQYILLSDLGTKKLGDIYSQLDYIISNKWKRKWIYENVYKRITSIYNEIDDISYHLNTFKDYQGIDKQLVINFIGSIQKKLYRGKITSIDNNYKIRVYKSTYNELCSIRKEYNRKICGRKINEIKIKPSVTIGGYLQS